MIATVRKYVKKLFATARKKALSGTDFVIISDNCWGAEAYKEFERPYNTPFVGLFLHTPCFLKLTEDFARIIQMPLRFVKETRYPVTDLHYPVAILGEDIEIHFLHYKSEEEALDKWQRRLARMSTQNDMNNYCFKLSAEADTVADTQVFLDRFYALPFKNKVSFATCTYPVANHIALPNEKLPDGLSLYYIARRIFDMPQWLSKGVVKRTFWNTLITKL